MTLAEDPTKFLDGIRAKCKALDKKREAATCFQQAVRLEPDYAEAWNNLGNALSDTGHFADAIAAYRRALAVAPAYADAHYNLAETLALLNDVDGAREHWLAYLQKDPNSTWAEQVRERAAPGLPELGDPGDHRQLQARVGPPEPLDEA